jgi:hypothetical protein
MKKTILLASVLFILLSCGPKRYGCGPNASSEPIHKKEVLKKNC